MQGPVFKKYGQPNMLHRMSVWNRLRCIIGPATKSIYTTHNTLSFWTSTIIYIASRLRTSNHRIFHRKVGVLSSHKRSLHMSKLQIIMSATERKISYSSSTFLQHMDESSSAAHRFVRCHCNSDLLCRSLRHSHRISCYHNAELPSKWFSKNGGRKCTFLT